MTSRDLTVRVEPSIRAVSRADWDALDHGGSPFLEWGFLAALEASGSVGAGTGWEPHYVLVETRGATGAEASPGLLGATLACTKRHSYGEYIFDWAWAQAASRAGIPYYPKLVVAAPMTPATGPRLLLAPGADPEPVGRRLVAAVRDLAERQHASSVHWLFTTAAEQQLLEREGFLPRASFQFHWRHRGERDFADFLDRMTSRRRKQIRKERERAQAAVDAIEAVPGTELTAGDLAAMDRFYRSTVAAHGGSDYLRPGFFPCLHRLAPERLLFVRALRRGEVVAGALYLVTDRALFGRYWGADEEIPFLHFELAYYAGIEVCLARGIERFEAGAQGEHKLLRGFEPAATHSSHLIRHRGLAEAVERFVQRETREVAVYMEELRGYGPFKAHGAR
jgi:hypothetical protein